MWTIGLVVEIKLHFQICSAKASSLERANAVQTTVFLWGRGGGGSAFDDQHQTSVYNPTYIITREFRRSSTASRPAMVAKFSFWQWSLNSQRKFSVMQENRQGELSKLSNKRL